MNITKHLKRLSAITVLAAAVSPAAARIAVDRIDPPHWWAGMVDTTLQLQIHGRGIRAAEFSVDYPGVSIDSVVRLDGSPDWQHVYLNIGKDALPGVMKLKWREGGRTVSRNYELRARKPGKGAQGFSSADVLYLVMPDRFADGNPANNSHESLNYPVAVDRSDPNARHGGDFAGMARHLDYIDSLGVTAVWFNPVLENDMPGGSYHGYATTDYYRVDPRFGSNAEYAALVDSLHGRGIKTVMDMIFNHCGDKHPWVADPPASDWFNMQDAFEQTNYRLSALTDPYASERDRRLVTDGWFVAEMPDLNQLNPHVMRYLLQNSIWWIEETGIDGIRMDTYSYADEKAMGDWVEAVERQYPGFNIVGECWFADTAGESYWQKGSPLAAAMGHDTRLTTVMDFPLMIKCRGMKPFAEQTGAWSGLNTIYDHLALDFAYPDPQKVLRFLDNHDTERFILSEPDSLGAWKQALTVLLTIPGIPQIYYGTELLMSGTREGGDGNVRKDVPGGFPGDTADWLSESGRPAKVADAYRFIAELNRIRKMSPALTAGSMKHFLPDNGIYLYQRKYGDDEVIVVLNGTDGVVEADMERYAEVIPEGALFTDMLRPGCEVSLAGKISFEPRQISLFKRIR